MAFDTAAGQINCGGWCTWDQWLNCAVVLHSQAGYGFILGGRLDILTSTECTWTITADHVDARIFVV